MPKTAHKKKVTRRTRFDNPRTKGDKKVTQRTRFEPKEDPADVDDDQRKASRGGHEPDRKKKNRRDRADDTDNQDNGDEQLRLQMIQTRNRRRRYPWLPAAAVIPLGLLAQLIGALFTLAANVPAANAVLVIATIPLGLAGAVTLRHCRTHLHWWPEIAAAGVGSAAVVYWIGVAGLSWLTVLVILLGTIAGGTRWWKAHPIGPGVAPLEPPREQPDKPVKETRGTDPICVAWQQNNARGGGKARDSKLTNRRETEHTVTYDLELSQGQQTINDMLANRGPLAGGIGVDADQMVFKRAPRGAGAHMAVLTIITKDPVAKVRYYTGPTVEDGVIKGVGRLIDGSGEADIVMYDDGGMRPTMVVGSTGAGKSGATNILVCGALSGGTMNLLYADPKGNSSTALASRARIAVIGKQNVLKLPHLIEALLEARGEMAARLGADQLFPTVDNPGWMFLHEEYSIVANDPLAMRVWTESVNMIRALGLWAVAANQSQGQPQWGSDHARSAWATQPLAFRTNSKSSSDLVPGLNFDPNELPVDDRGMPIPGMAVHGYLDTPVRWDWLPSDADAARIAARGLPAPPYPTSTAFDTFINQPPVDLMDEIAITAILGPAVNGRWQVGGRGATHKFPETYDGIREASGWKPKGSWGDRATKITADGDQSALTGYGPVADQALQELKLRGHAKTADLALALDKSPEATKQLMHRLSKRGVVTSPRDAEWELAATGDVEEQPGLVPS